MVIQISVDTTEPLAGTATAERGAQVPFTGWLELLRAISVLVDAQSGLPRDPGQPTGPVGVQQDSCPAGQIGRLTVEG